MDTHTAVAYKVYKDYVAETGDETPALIASTASPYKFAESVAEGLGMEKSENGFECVRTLEAETGVKVQKGLKDLDKKPVIHTGVCEVSEMPDVIIDALK